MDISQFQTMLLPKEGTTFPPTSSPVLALVILWLYSEPDLPVSARER